MHRPSTTTSPESPHAALQAGLDGPTRLLPVEDLDPNSWNARRAPDTLDAEDQSLAESLRTHGVLENLLVRPKPDGRFEVVFGARRLRCAKAAGLALVPATVRELDDAEARILTVTENLQRKNLHFLEEAQAVADLFAEHWTVDMIASQLGKPRSWVARRKRLLDLTLSWRQLASEPEPWMAGWSPAHFEHIATLAPEAQEELLATGTDRLEDCVTAGDLAQLTRSLTRDLRGFPWDLDDADLDPEAGPCSACPQRSSHHPGLFDDQLPEPSEEPERRGRRRPAAAGGIDRCLNPQCAERKGSLFVAQKVAKLSDQHDTVLRLQDDASYPAIPGAVRPWNVEAVSKRTPGAVPAVVASGADLGSVRWVRPSPSFPTRETSPAPAAKGAKPLAERRALRDRRRKILALADLKQALLAAPAPELRVSVGLAATFGTLHCHRSPGSSHDPALPRVASGLTAAAVTRRMLAALPASIAPPAAGPVERSPVQGTGAAAPAAPSSTGPDQPVDSPAEGCTPAPGDPEALDDPEDTSADDAATLSSFVPAAQLWDTFHALVPREDLHAAVLWTRTLPVLLARLTPGPEARDVEAEWAEAQRLTSLLGLDLELFFDRAVAKLPDPKAWAVEEAALAKTAQAAPVSEPPAPRRGSRTSARRRSTPGAEPAALDPTTAA